MTAEGIIWDVDAKHQPAAFSFFLTSLANHPSHQHRRFMTGRGRGDNNAHRRKTKEDVCRRPNTKLPPEISGAVRRSTAPAAHLSKVERAAQSGRHVFYSPFSLRRTPRLVTAESVMERAKVKESSRW